MPLAQSDIFLLLLQQVKLIKQLISIVGFKKIERYCDINYIIPQNDTPNIHSKFLNIEISNA